MQVFPTRVFETSIIGSDAVKAASILPELELSTTGLNRTSPQISYCCGGNLSISSIPSQDVGTRIAPTKTSIINTGVTTLESKDTTKLYK